MITGSNLEAWHTQMGETTMRWVYAVLLLIAVSGWAVGAEAEETGAAAEEMVTPADPQTSVLANAETGWASRYVSEGVNWLDEGGLATMEGSLSAGPLTVGTWWGLGDSIDYQESNLFMVYGLEFSSLAPAPATTGSTISRTIRTIINWRPCSNGFNCRS